MKPRPGSLSAIGFLALMIVAISVLACIPNDPVPLRLEQLANIQFGDRFEDIAREIGGGKWLSAAETYTVLYEVEGDMQLVLVFEDGIHLSGVMLYRPDGTVTTIDSDTLPDVFSP